MELIENMAASDHAILHDRTHVPTKRNLLELSSQDALLAQNKLLAKQLESLTETLSKLPTQLQVTQPSHSIVMQVGGCSICGGAHESGCCIPLDDDAKEVNYKGNQHKPMQVDFQFTSKKRYEQNVHSRNILLERNVNLYITENDEFRQELERRRWHKTLTRHPNGRIDVALVKEFYGNLFDLEDKSPRQVRVRGKLIKFDGEMLNAFLETPVVLEPEERYLAYSRFCHTHPDPQELPSKLFTPRRSFVLNAEGAPWKLLRKDLTTLVQTWSVLSYSNLTPTSHTFDLNMDRARLVYGLVMRMDMDVGSFISGQISQMAQSNSSRLGFPALITALCIARGIVPDSLTFESLSPAINLAYIRKNCWNPDDPTITFPGTYKTRARGPDVSAPSSSAPLVLAAPAPPTPLPAPFGTSAQSSNAMVPMLQSLHHGLCLMMQSIHNLAQHQPIISMEDFMAQVAWSEVQPSPLRGGEAPTAQEPQSELEATPEAKADAEETPEDTPVATPAEDTDYVANMAVAHSSWDPWPTPAQDTPLPAQDSPSSPHDDPTPAQED
ncbi:hypothetical protein HKD37_01G000654 [Glycine soja]